MLVPTFLLFAPLLVSPRGTTSAVPHAAPDAITWQKSYEPTLVQAKEQKKVVFIAINMDGEKANERTLAKVYTDKAVVDLSRNTLNLIASTGEHAAPDKPCPKFDGLFCLDHRRIETTLRKELLKPDADGFVVAPQHVFLDPEGKVLLSVPFEITAPELAWCFVSALHAVDPASTAVAPAGSRPPRRLIQHGVYDPEHAAGGIGHTPTHQEVVDTIKELRKTGRGGWDLEAIRNLLVADDADAREFILQELKSAAGFGRGGGGGGGRGGGGGAGALGNGGENRHTRLMHWIGILSPPSWWAVAVECLSDEDEKLRDETAVALEQLAAPESVKALTKALAEEKSKAVQKDLLRALGSAGAGDKAVRAMVLKRLKSEKDPLLMVNAIVAAGALGSGDDVAAELQRFLATGTPEERIAAVCAMGFSRDARYMKDLESASNDVKTAGLAAAAKAALLVAQGGPLSGLHDAIKSVAKDTIERERWFGKAKD